MRDRRFRHLLFDLLDRRLDVLGALGDDVVQRALAQGAAEQVMEQFAGPFVRQELILPEVRGHSLELRAVLNRSVDSFGERSFVCVAAGTSLDLGLMLRDDQPRGGQIVNLPFFDALGGSARERAPAVGATLNAVTLGAIGLVDPLQRMPRLPAGRQG